MNLNRRTTGGAALPPGAAPAGLHGIPRRLACAWLAALALASAGAVSPRAHAQNWPARPVRMIVPSPPGNSVDVAARILADALSKAWKQPVFVENRPGGAGVPGMVAGKMAAPDGYTIVIGPSSTIGINPLLYGNLPYEPRRDFEPVNGLYLGPMMLLAHVKSPFRSLADVIDGARKNPQGLSIAIGGPVGTTQHMTTELFRSRAGIDFVNVHYKGSAPAMQDLLGGQVPLLFDSVTSGLPQVTSGTVRAIAVTSAQRMPQLPDVPTVAELGFPHFEGVGWGGLLVPKGTPAAIIERMTRDASEELSQPAVQQQMLARGLIADPRGAREWNAFVESERSKWGRLIKSAHIKAE